MTDSISTTEEKRLKKLDELKARLQKVQAQQNSLERKRRNGQLFAWGVLIEEIYKSADEAGRQKLVESARKHLKDRNLERAIQGFTRLSETKKKPLDKKTQ